ncbi:MAG: WD40 repeat domain-containing protein [Gammaproteobacteria bacterium]|nr:WD40 repeat domain-containing protein [Gammaproteobacteria bacterium]
MRMNRQAESVHIRWRLETTDSVQDLAWSPDGRWLAVAVVSGSLTVADGATGDLRQNWLGHAGGTLKVAWSRDSRWLASSGQDGCARVWDITSGEERLQLVTGNAWVGDVSFSPYADLLITAAGKELRAWSLDGQPLHHIQPHISTITALAWHPQQPLLASTAYSQVHLWDWGNPAAPGEQILLHSSPLLNACWAPNGQYLACGCQDNSLRCWTWPELTDFQMSGYASKVCALAWDRASHWLATGDREIITLWDFTRGPPTGKVPLNIEGPFATVRELAFQPDGDWLATGDQSGHLLVWALNDQGYRLIWQGTLRGGFQRLAWHPRERLLAVGGEDGTVAVFEFA